MQSVFAKCFLVGGLFFASLVVTKDRANAAPIRGMPDLQSIHVYERTTSLYVTVYAPNDGRLGRTENLHSGTSEFTGAVSEAYDVYYSDANGTPNFDGAWLTIDAVFTPDAGGHNITDVKLVFGGGGFEFADRWSRVVTQGVSGDSTSAAGAVDGDDSTHTTLGGGAFNDNRLSITVGFASSVPEPSSAMLLVLGCLCIPRRWR